MTPYQSIRFIDVLHRRKWRMPKATLLREFGQPDLVSRKAPTKEWFYILTPHILIDSNMPRGDYAHRIEVRGASIRFGGCNRLSMWFYEKNCSKSVTWWRLLRVRTSP